MNYQVVESKVMRHPDGRTTSIHGAHPGDGFEAVSNGWTIYNKRTGTYGAYALKAGATRDEAQALADKLNAL